MELRQRQQQRLEIYLNSHTNNCCCCCCLRDVARPNSRRYLSLSCRWFRRWLASLALATAMAMADCRRRADRATWRLETLAGFLVVCASASALAECAARRCVARADAAAAALGSTRPLRFLGAAAPGFAFGAAFAPAFCDDDCDCGGGDGSALVSSARSAPRTVSHPERRRTKRSRLYGDRTRTLPVEAAPALPGCARRGPLALIRPAAARRSGL